MGLKLNINKYTADNGDAHIKAATAEIRTPQHTAAVRGKVNRLD